MLLSLNLGFPEGSDGKESASNAEDAGDLGSGRRRSGFIPQVENIPWRKKWQPTPVFLLGNPMDRGAWQATVLGDRHESNMTE